MRSNNFKDAAPGADHRHRLYAADPLRCGAAHAAVLGASGGAYHTAERTFTSTSAVCVTGLVVVDTGDTFSLFGQLVIAVLIQIGGLGVASIGMGLALVTGRRISPERAAPLVREALNVENPERHGQTVRPSCL